LTNNKDGFDEMELMSYKVYRPSTGEIFDVEVEYNQQMPQTGYFTGEGLSAIKSITTINTGIGDTFANRLFIYPNPTNGKVTIGGINGIDQILVMSSEGAVVMRFTPKTEGNQVFDLSALPAGFYQVQIRTSQGLVTRKIVKGL